MFLKQNTSTCAAKRRRKKNKKKIEFVFERYETSNLTFSENVHNVFETRQNLESFGFFRYSRGKFEAFVDETIAFILSQNQTEQRILFLLNVPTL